MPIRMLRDWTDSEPVNELDDGAEVLFVRLMMKADDYGRFSANPKLIRSLCFPLRDGIRESDISRRLSECEAAGLIAIYEAKGKPILQIVKFGQRLRQRTAKYAEPPPEVSRRIAELCGECPQVAASGGLNGTRIEPEQEYEQEPEWNRVIKFSLWSGATAEELKTPSGAQRAFECVREHGLCTDDERLLV